MQFIDLQAQLQAIRPAIDARIKTVLDHGQFIMGPEVFELEEKLANYVGTRHCISCANGTDALQISLMALGVGQDDIVFTTAFSFFATAEVIPMVGATPYFADIDPGTYNLCPTSLEKAIQQAIDYGSGTPRAVIAVDMFGLPANYPEISRICEKYGLLLIEDAAQGFGGAINGQKCGSFGDIATTSFFPAKPLGCYGDGGAIFTNDDQLAELCKSIRVHGKGEHKYENVRIGLNSRLDTLQAAILLEKLSVLDKERTIKREIAKRYTEQLSKAVNCPVVPNGYESAWAQYTINCPHPKNVSAIRAAMDAKDVPTMVYYPIGLNQQSPLQHYPGIDTPNSDRVVGEVFSLPMHAHLEVKDIHYVTDCLLQVINNPQIK